MLVTAIAVTSATGGDNNSDSAYTSFLFDASVNVPDVDMVETNQVEPKSTSAEPSAAMPKFLATS